MLNASNQLKAIKLVNALTGDPLKRAQAMSIIIILNDSQFTILFDGLNTSRFYISNFYNDGYVNAPHLPPQVKIRFVWTDILTGENGTGFKILSNALFEPVEQWNNVLKNFDENLFFIAKINDKIFFKNPAVGGYNIPGYEPVILPGYGTGGGTTGGTTPAATTETKTDLNIESLIFPAAIAIGLYLFLK